MSYEKATIQVIGNRVPWERPNGGMWVSNKFILFEYSSSMILFGLCFIWKYTGRRLVVNRAPITEAGI